ncbi:MAG: hypothetical protein SFV15_25195 [Polyangiaceae bacterium]|nr:hypothetical protein [Polyangiaceae bacterium]
MAEGPYTPPHVSALPSIPPIAQDARANSTQELARSGWFLKVRVGVLLLVLASVSAWGVWDAHVRKARTAWRRPLQVAFVLVQQGAVPEPAVQALKARIATLESHLANEMRRYRSEPSVPFRISVFGPAPAPAKLPDPEQQDVFDLLRFNYDLWRFAYGVDAALDIESSRFDSRVYLILREAANRDRNFVEGFSQSGGRLGVVSVELDTSMVDFGLFVATHELLHTLGASDKYTADGVAMVPQGLAEPWKVPLYPQRYAEVMARHVPLSSTEDVPPGSLDELAIGLYTAQEIGWLR